MGRDPEGRRGQYVLSAHLRHRRSCQHSAGSRADLRIRSGPDRCRMGYMRILCDRDRPGVLVLPFRKDLCQDGLQRIPFRKAGFQGHLCGRRSVRIGDVRRSSAGDPAERHRLRVRRNRRIGGVHVCLQVHRYRADTGQCNIQVADPDNIRRYRPEASGQDRRGGSHDLQGHPCDRGVLPVVHNGIRGFPCRGVHELRQHAGGP